MFQKQLLFDKMTVHIIFERDTIMKKFNLTVGILFFLVGCTQANPQTSTTTVKSTTENTTTTQTTTSKKENHETSTINENLDAFAFDNKTFEIRASRRWLKEESTNSNLLTLVGYRSRVNVFFSIAKTADTSLETVATNTFKESATQYGISTTLPLVPLKNATHPTVKTIYDIKKDNEKKVLVLYTVDIKGVYVNVTAIVSTEIFEEIRQELDTIVNSLTTIKQ